MKGNVPLIKFIRVIAKMIQKHIKKCESRKNPKKLRRENERLIFRYLRKKIKMTE